MWAKLAAEKTIELLAAKSAPSLLDVGSGGGEASAFFERNGYRVTAVDFGTSVYARRDTRPPDVQGDFNDLDFAPEFDVVWASHVLEHQKNVHTFLTKCKSALKPDGFLCVTVPPLKHEIVGGHLSLWNAGLLLYNLVLAGFDCSQARVRTYGYNISVIVANACIELPSELDFDCGDIGKLRQWLPEDCRQHGFDGRIKQLNW